MTRIEFDTQFAATADNWFEPETLQALNDAAYARLADVDVSDWNITDIVKSAFDHANNEL